MAFCELGFTFAVQPLPVQLLSALASLSTSRSSGAALEQGRPTVLVQSFGLTGVRGSTGERLWRITGSTRKARRGLCCALLQVLRTETSGGLAGEAVALQCDHLPGAGLVQRGR